MHLQVPPPVRSSHGRRMEHRDLLRFRHCGKTLYTLADGPVPIAPVELRCPVCGQAMRFSLADAPVRIQSPIKNGHRATCCFLMTSQHGAAALTEDTDSELHVGLSNSEGVVFSYTASGVQRQKQGWEHSITVPLIAPGNSIPHFSNQWDRRLDMFAGLDEWTADRFEEQREFGSCCYGFALGFINQLMRLQGQQPISRECFTAQYVLPRIEAASRYLSLYQHICHHGYHIHNAPDRTEDRGQRSNPHDIYLYANQGQRKM